MTSADGLMNIAELVNGGKSDINITLTADIDLTGKDWTPMVIIVAVLLRILSRKLKL